MLRQVGVLLCCGATLLGCSSIMGSPDPRPPDPAPQPLPAVKQILANSTDVLFSPTANPRNVAISSRRVQLSMRQPPSRSVPVLPFVLVVVNECKHWN